jgi:hypothetical protein
MADANSSALSLLWNECLRATAAASLGAWIALALSSASSSPSSSSSSSTTTTSSTRSTLSPRHTGAAASPPAPAPAANAHRCASLRDVWDRHVWSRRAWLALLYVVACGVRATWPRQDGDRVCMWDHPLSPPLVGRSLACCAEVAFAALVCAAVVRTVESPAAPRIAAAVLAANVVAQSCCNYAVVTRDQRGHVVEESIWTVSGAIVVALCAAQLYRRGGFRQPNGGFLTAATVGGLGYVAFMVTVDVPMYVYRALHDTAVGTQFASIGDGLREMAECHVITQADAYWKTEMPWMSLYFTVAVWVMLWLGFAELTPVVPLEQIRKRE